MDQILNENDVQCCFNDFFTYQETLGQGAFGTVVKAIDNLTNEVVAVKIIQKAIIKKFDRLEQEAAIFSSLNHNNIVKFFDVKRTDTRILLVMELINGGSLQKVMNTMKQQDIWFSQQESKQIIQGILLALSYIHDNQFVHRDLKPDNIMIGENATIVKITDFGLSSHHNRYALMTKKCGTLSYMAPELILKKVYNKNVDIWSVGIIMYQLLNNGRHPYYKTGLDQESLIQNITNMHTELNYGNMTPLEVSLFQRMTELDQSRRYSAYQALLHPWINESREAQIPQNVLEIQDLWLMTQKQISLIKCIMLLKCLMKNTRIVRKRYIYYPTFEQQQMLRTDQSDEYLYDSPNNKTSNLLNFIKIKQQLKAAKQSGYSSTNASPVLVRSNDKQETTGDLMFLHTVLPDIKGSKDSPEKQQKLTFERMNSTTLNPRGISISPQKISSSVNKQHKVLLKPLPASFELQREIQTVDLHRQKQYQQRQSDNIDFAYTNIESCSPYHTKTTSFHQSRTTKYKTDYRPRQKRIQSTIDQRKSANENYNQKYFQKKMV